MRLQIFYLTITALMAVSLLSCEKDDNEPKQEDLENKLIGTWKYESKTDYYWYQFVFNEDLTGKRTDGDNEDDDFTYTFTSEKVDFTSGFPYGEYKYSIDDNSQLIIFGDTLVKQ